MRSTFLAATLAIFLLLIGFVIVWVFFRGPNTAWIEFVDFSNKWGNVAGVLGLILAIVGLGITFFGFVVTLGEQDRIRAAVRSAIERAATNVLASRAEEGERLLLEFKDAVHRGEWRRAGEKCDDARARIARVLDNPHLSEAENLDLVDSVDDLRQVSRYITVQKTLRTNPAKGFHQPKLDAVDRVIAVLNRLLARIGNQVWEA